MAPTDPIADAIDSAERQPKATEVEAIAQVTLTFLPDGGLHMASRGEFRAPILWAMSQYLGKVGDNLFEAAVAENKAAKAARQPQIVVPMGAMGRIDR